MSVREVVVPADNGKIARIENDRLNKIRFALVFGILTTNVHFATFTEGQRNDGRVGHERLRLVTVIRNVVFSILVASSNDVVDVERMSIDDQSAQMICNLMNDGQGSKHLIAANLSMLIARK